MFLFLLDISNILTNGKVRIKKVATYIPILQKIVRYIILITCNNITFLVYFNIANY